ncbi:MAG: M15 family metallopeptidase [Geminicoccaceae bacterium]
MSIFRLGNRSLDRMVGVHSDLQRVVKEAINRTKVDFTVLEGVRSPERQAKLYESGASTTLNSRHLTGHAVDLGAWVDGRVAWDWPLYHLIADAVLDAARSEGVFVDWGGHWRSFPDGPHFQLPWDLYDVQAV